MENCSLSIEVWGHRNRYVDNHPKTPSNHHHKVHRSRSRREERRETSSGDKKEKRRNVQRIEERSEEIEENLQERFGNLNFLENILFAKIYRSK